MNIEKLIQLFSKFLNAIKNPILIIRFLMFRHYKYVFRRIYQIPLNCEGLISPVEAVYLYKTALRAKKEGYILDFGSYKGLSACVLSHAAKKLDKLVIAFESFQGLPPHWKNWKANFLRKEIIKLLKLNLKEM